MEEMSTTVVVDPVANIAFAYTILVGCLAIFMTFMKVVYMLPEHKRINGIPVSVKARYFQSGVSTVGIASLTLSFICAVLVLLGSSHWTLVSNDRYCSYIKYFFPNCGPREWGPIHSPNEYTWLFPLSNGLSLWAFWCFSISAKEILVYTLPYLAHVYVCLSNSYPPQHPAFITPLLYTPFKALCVIIGLFPFSFVHMLWYWYHQSDQRNPYKGSFFTGSALKDSAEYILVLNAAYVVRIFEWNYSANHQVILGIFVDIALVFTGFMLTFFYHIAEDFKRSDKMKQSKTPAKED